MQNKLILYTYFRSSTSHRVRIALNLKNIDYESRYINLKDGEQKDPKYSEINPNNAVPALQVSDKDIIIESMAILEYLEETHPEPRLLPQDPILKAKIRGFCEVINSGIHPYHNLRLFEWIDVIAPKFDRVEFAHNMLIKEFKVLESLLQQQKGKYSFGDSITLADCLLVPQVGGAVARFNVNLDDFPRLKEVYNNLKDIPEFVKASPNQQSDYQ